MDLAWAFLECFLIRRDDLRFLIGLTAICLEPPLAEGSIVSERWPVCVIGFEERNCITNVPFGTMRIVSVLVTIAFGVPITGIVDTGT